MVQRRHVVFVHTNFCKKFVVFVVALAVLCSGCISSQPANEVIVYTSRDQMFSQPILEAFEQETGIDVKAVYDTGATKTAGLTNRLIAEKSNPRADVFWNSETGRTVVLKNEGILAPYCSPNAADIPLEYRDPDCYWTGFGARARVVIYNTNLVSGEEVPTSIYDFLEPEWKGKVAIGRAWLGTMATHHAALFLLLGDDAAKKYSRDLKDNDIQMLIGNTAVRDAVSAGEFPVGIIDTSDAQEAISDGKPVKVLYPDQGGDEIGVMLIPNTISLIKGGPNQVNGKKFIDYMLSKEMESTLAYSRSSQIPLREGVDKPDHVPDVDALKLMPADFNEVALKMNESNQYLLELFTS